MTRDHFKTQLELLHEDVRKMAEHSLAMLHEGVLALTTLDSQLSEKLSNDADKLANFDEELETRILKLLALQSPMAGDLRRVGAALKLITYINRVGRYGYDVGRIAKTWPEGQPHISKLVNLDVMAQKVEEMMELVLVAYSKNAKPDIPAIAKIESQVDEMRRSVWRECLTYMAENPRNIEPCANYMMVGRYLERAADNVCKMAEKQYFAATGKRIIID